MIAAFSPKSGHWSGNFSRSMTAYLHPILEVNIIDVHRCNIILFLISPFHCFLISQIKSNIISIILFVRDLLKKIIAVLFIGYFPILDFSFINQLLSKIVNTHRKLFIFLYVFQISQSFNNNLDFLPFNHNSKAFTNDKHVL